MPVARVKRKYHKETNILLKLNIMRILTSTILFLLSVILLSCGNKQQMTAKEAFDKHYNKNVEAFMKLMLSDIHKAISELRIKYILVELYLKD